MTTSAFKLIAVTNRHLTQTELPVQIERIANIARPDILILREKDLSEDEYVHLASSVIKVCEQHGIECILHNYPSVARTLKCSAIHMPFENFCREWQNMSDFQVMGTSIHSKDDALWAWKHGATYVTAGHIYETQCKKGLKGRGLKFLREICLAVPIPVYAIGGINKEKIPDIFSAGAAGACMMSEYMKM